MTVTKPEPMQRAKGTDRILDLLEFLAHANRPLPRGELVSGTGMPRSTVYSLTELLLNRQWVEETEAGLQLGPQASFLSNAYLHQNGFERMARRELAALSAKTGTLSEIDVAEDWMHVVALSEGRSAEGYLRPVEGSRLPLMPSAAARVLLADVPPELIRSNIPDSALVDVAGRPVTWESFHEDIRVGMLQGYVTVTGWLEGTVTTLACPLIDGQRRALASLCMIIGTEALRERLHFYLINLQDSAQRISELIQRVGWPYAEAQWKRLHGLA